jgi:bifunctional NMN adenylyltransferase/nudix hydrolase
MNYPADKGTGAQVRPIEETYSIFDAIAKEKQYDLLVFIGRFQPFHNEHQHIIDTALKLSKNVLVLIGSAGKARSVRNPFTFAERKRMIAGNYPGFLHAGGPEQAMHDHGMLRIRPLFDKTYNEAAWVKQVQDIVTGEALDIANPSVNDKIFHANGIRDLKIGLIGTSKDHTSYYLKLFPQWQKNSVDVPLREALHATDLRNMFFEELNFTPAVGLTHTDVVKKSLSNWCPESVINFLYEDYMAAVVCTGGFRSTRYYDQLVKELAFVRNYKKQWEAAPYPVKHATVDAVVEQSGHVLVVKRKSEPGKGLWALPGGHLNEHETQLDGAIRELREETKLKVPDAVLKGSLVAEKTFGDPHRSQIGRVITQAFHFRLAPQLELPKVKGSDDADKAVWLPISEVAEDMFFDDHYHIITHFLGL